ncbi:MAG: hypothetical protein V3T64_15550, partial [Myxococcota bacterium]
VYHWLGYRALALILVGRVSEAADAARESLARTPSSLAYFVLAGAHAHEGRRQEAGEAYGEAARRVEKLLPVDYASRARQIAPDPEWGQAVSSAFQLAKQAAEERNPRAEGSDPIG